jgi:hypothetical protein
MLFRLKAFRKSSYEEPVIFPLFTVHDICLRSDFSYRNYNILYPTDLFF